MGDTNVTDKASSEAAFVTLVDALRAYVTALESEGYSTADANQLAMLGMGDYAGE